MLVVDVLEQHDDEAGERVARVEHRLRVVERPTRKARPLHLQRRDRSVAGKAFAILG